MIRILICDDEKELRQALRGVIQRTLQLKGLAYEIKEYDSGEGLLAEQAENDADIIFLDIEMKELNGVETAKHIRQFNQRAAIIFITAFADFVFHGYEVRALNYIIKPYDDKKIITVLEAALEELGKTAPQYYLIEQQAGSYRLTLNDTWYFMSERRQIRAINGERSLTFYGKLNELEFELPDFFIRVHNRYLVNLNHLISIEGSTIVCGLDSLPVSRQYKQELNVAFAKKILSR